MKVSTIILCAVFTLSCAQPAAGEEVVVPSRESEEATFRVVRVAGGLEHPWGLTFLPEGGILVTERSGRLLRIDGEERREIEGLPQIAAGGQGGLLDVTLHPGYDENRLVYISYVTRLENGSGTGTAVARGRLADDRLEDVETIFRMNEGGTTGRHFGSRLLFLSDGTLLVSLGERGEPERAQDLGDHAGSIVRITDDGGIPEDNPLLGNEDALPEIYTYGNRNVQGMALHPETGRVWQAEHGPQGGDELNLVVPGENYGWPEATFGAQYGSGRPIGEPGDAPGYQAPVTHWTPSYAPSGMTFYTGDRFPGWRGNLFIGALAHRHLRRVVLDGERVIHEEVLLRDTLGRIRDVVEGPDGFLWLLTDERDGGLFRIEPAG